MTRHGAPARTRVSWIDWILGPPRRGWVPWWGTVLVLWGVAVVATLIVFAVAGEDASDRRAYELLSTSYAPMALFGYRLTLGRMGRAFDTFCPALTSDAGTLAERRRRLTTMPAGVAAVAAGIGALTGSVGALAEPFVHDLFARSWGAAVLLGAVNYAWNTAVAVTAVVQVVRVMRAIAGLHREADRIDLFVTAPNRAFAPVTATVGVLLVAVASYSLATDPETLENPLWAGFAAGCLVLAVVVFVVPLMGMRRRLRAQQEQLEQEAMSRIRRIAIALETAVDEGHHDEVTRLKTALEALDRERRRVTDASAWPWERRTLGGFVSTLLIPIVVWFVTSVLGRILGL